ncbi:MAG: polysaccharide biosynthesis tyrosine autokinase [Gemmatimonadales bacterium]|nr:polysaccharide biosynthesis tyrosine autokinase [Gemmatimonadales bacterium]
MHSTAMKHNQRGEMTGPDHTRLTAWRGGNGDEHGSAVDMPRRTVMQPAASTPAAASESDWHHYWMAVTRHKWIVLGVTLFGLIVGIIATRFLDPRYSARAILWVETAVGRERGVRSDELLDSRGWVEIVTSNAVLDSVVRQQRLFLHPETAGDSVALRTFHITDRVVPGIYRLVVDKAGRAIRLELDDGTVIQRGRVGQPIGDNVGFDWQPAPGTLQPGSTIAFRVQALPDASAQLAAALKARIDQGGNFLRIQLKGTQPVATAATLNAVIERVVAVEADMKRRKFEDLAAVLGEQYQSAREKLTESENALRDFRVRTAGSAVMLQASPAAGGVDGGPGEAGRLYVEVNQLRRDRATLDQLAAEAARSGVSLEVWKSVPAVVGNPILSGALEDVARKQAELRNLRYQYTAEAAPVQQLNSELEQLERQVIPSLARQLSRDLGERIRRTAPRADTAVRVLQAVPSVALDQSRLLREQQMAEEQFLNVGKQYDAARLALVSSLPDVRVLDPALVPRRPASDYAPLLVLLATLASFGVAVVGVTVKDRMDPKVRYPEQITSGMRLQILGAVPHVSWRVSANGDGPSQVIEALRGLRLRVLHAHSGDGPLMLTVTSPGIGDGKSFVSLNLALSFADAGYKTLLVDGDVRRGVQHKALKTPSTPGLTDVVAGRVPLEAALRTTSYPGLTFLSAGTRMQRAPERLLSQRMRDLMAKLRSLHDVVIVDSAPLGAGADPLVLGTLTENLLLVLRTGQSDLKMAGTKLEVLNSLPVRVIGAVLNDVRSSGVYRYYMYSSAEYELVDDEGPTREALPSVLGGWS